MPQVKEILLCRDARMLVNKKLINLREIRKATWTHLECFTVCKIINILRRKFAHRNRYIGKIPSKALMKLFYNPLINKVKAVISIGLQNFLL